MNYQPIIKGRGFCPNPVAVYGIPEIADSISFPDVVGTSGYCDYWDEQIDRCHNGYHTGGMFVSGRYYYYLNFCFITTLKRGIHHPDFVDLDYEFFNLVEYVKENNKGIICIKPRRRGLSEKGTNGIIDYGMRFTPKGYRAGLCAGKDEYIETFLQRLKYANANRPPELRLHYDIDNKEQFRAGYDIKTEAGMVTMGSGNNVLARTMDTKPNVFKGELLDDCVFEEGGEFPILKKGFGATKACFAVGDRMVGTPYIWGTGGNINSSMAEFSDMYEEAHNLGLERFEFYADRLFIGCFVGSTNEDGQLVEDVPYLEAEFAGKGYSREQIIGCEDTQRAVEKIKERAKVLSTATDRQLYYAFLTDNPLDKKQLFLRFTGGHFDTDRLSEQYIRIEERKTPPFFKFKLSWKKNENGTLIIPLQVERTPCGENDSYDGDFTVMLRHFPVDNQKDLDVGGIDSYDQDSSEKSKSLGSMVVLRRKGNTLKNDEGHSISHKRVVVCLVRMRPKRKEIFYETCLMVSVMYNLLKNVLVEASKPMIIEYFKANLGERYLAKRPLSFESENSEQRHDYGVLLTSSPKSKPQMIGVLQNWVWEESDECWFLLIISGLINYDVMQKDSDWDEVDALGVALIRDIDMKKNPSTLNDEINKSKLFETIEWEEDSNGVLVQKRQASSYPYKNSMQRQFHDDLENDFYDTDDET